MLPLASFAETSGTFVGLDSQWQSFTGAVAPFAESRPGWKILRVLGNVSAVKDFDYVASTDIRDELADTLKMQPAVQTESYLPPELNGNDSDTDTLTLISDVAMYRTDSLLRRSAALQQTPENQQALVARIHPKTLAVLDLTDAEQILITQGECSVAVDVQPDDTIVEGCLYLPVATEVSRQLGIAFGKVSVSPVEALADA